MKLHDIVKNENPIYLKWWVLLKNIGVPKKWSKEWENQETKKKDSCIYTILQRERKDTVLYPEIVRF